jgi:hypothetical protein
MKRFFLLMLDLSSPFMLRSIKAARPIRNGAVPHIVATYLRRVAGILESIFAHRVGDVICRKVFLDFPPVLAIADVSPMLINRPSWHEEHHYSGKYVCHCLKILALVSPDRQPVHFSHIYRGATHDMEIFDHSEVATFLTYQDDRGCVKHNSIVDDLR